MARGALVALASPSHGWHGASWGCGHSLGVSPGMLQEEHEMGSAGLEALSLPPTHVPHFCPCCPCSKLSDAGRCMDSCSCRLWVLAEHRSAWSHHPTLTSCYIPKHHFQATATTLLRRGNKRAEPSGSTSPSRSRASSPGSAAGSGGESIDVSSPGWGCRWLGPVFPAEIPPSSSAAPSDTCSEMPPGCALTQERMGGSLGTTPFLPGWLRLVLLLAAAAFGAINSCGSCLWSARSG